MLAALSHVHSQIILPLNNSAKQLINLTVFNLGHQAWLAKAFEVQKLIQ